MSILDEHLAVAVVQHAARRAQRERPLVVVLGHLLVLGVFDNLEEPEADAEDRKYRDTGDLQHGEPDGNPPAIFLYGHSQCFERLNFRRSIAPGVCSMIANAMMPITAL